MKIKYRPEIDGLRTIAVLSVIIYHMNIYVGSALFFKGGFFGVDIFFVISGFLITSLIIAELEETERFSIFNFYERRIRRIFPILFLVIFVSIPFAFKYLLPAQMIDFSKSLLASLFFGSNFYWHYAFQQYGAESAALRPFVHTWSLSVEEQFYVFFPLIMIMIHRWAKPYRLIILSIFTLLSLSLAQWTTMSNPSLSFHMLPSRFWELTTGAIVAHILYVNPEIRPSRLYKWLPHFGLFLILYSIVFIPFKFGQHPGYITLIPVLGTVFVIGFSRQNDFTTKLLSRKLFVGIGLISYSLYLWHHPIFAFGHILNHNPGFYDKTIWILLTFILSILSYFLIECPFRSRNRVSRKTLLLSVAAAIIAISAFSVYTI